MQHIAPDEGLWGTNIKEGHAIMKREDVSPAVNHNLRGERGVAERNDTADETGTMF